MGEDAGGFSEWTREQNRFCATAMLRAVSATTLVKHRPAMGQTIRPARGSIVASPEMAAYDPKPDYFFHWLRDSAIVADALREAIEDGALGPSAVEQLVDFVAFSLKLCRLDGPTFLRQGGYPEAIEPSFQQHVRSRAEIAEIIGDRALGEARYNADGSLDVLKWGRPQNDGPALRALVVMRFFALDAFRARARDPAMTLLGYDLDYTLSHWRRPCCDLWEEATGFHYHARLVQQAALAAGAEFLAAEGDEIRARACAAAATELLAELDRHFDSEDGVYRGRLAETGPNAPPPRRLDIAVVLAAIHAGRRSGPHSVVDPKMLATLFALERLFEEEYPINRARPADCAPALGRYAGDSYSAAAPITSRLWVRRNSAFFSRRPPQKAKRFWLPKRAMRRSLSCCGRPPPRSRGAPSREGFVNHWPGRRFVAATCILPRCAASRRPRANCRNSSANTTARRLPPTISPGAMPASSRRSRRGGGRFKRCRRRGRANRFLSSRPPRSKCPIGP